MKHDAKAIMKLDVKGMALTFGLLWGGAMLLVGVVNRISGDYGQLFLSLMASLYPGYYVGGSYGDVIVGSLYGLVDGGIGGAVLALLYNRLSK
jgi:hypothetical protein